MTDFKNGLFLRQLAHTNIAKAAVFKVKSASFTSGIMGL